MTYYTPEELMGPVWAIPDMITTSKLKRFAYQDEHRFAYTKTDDLKFQNCILANQPARAADTQARGAFFGDARAWRSQGHLPNRRLLS